MFGLGFFGTLVIVYVLFKLESDSKQISELQEQVIELEQNSPEYKLAVDLERAKIQAEIAELRSK